jgi:hypothetical protein
MTLDRCFLPTLALLFVLLPLAGHADEKQAPDDLIRRRLDLKLNAIEASKLLGRYAALVQRELDLQGSVNACITSGDCRLREYLQALQNARLDLDATKERLLTLEVEKARLSKHFEDPATQGRRLDAERIGQAAATKATATPDGVVRIGWARTDVAVTVDGMPLKPFAGLGSWAAFTPSQHGAMVMGDTVVFQDEVTPAMDAAFAGGLGVTGLHNHFFYDEPKVYFMHIGGQGEPEQLAAAVKGVWDAIKKVRADQPQPATRFPGGVPKEGKIEAAAIEKILGHKSEIQQGVVKVTIGREGTMHGVKVAGSMGLTTWAAFSGSDELAAVDGDFIMTAEEVQPVLRALRKADIHVVALHNHMVGEQPPFYFTHFWGKGPTKGLAAGLKSALDAQAKAGGRKENH